MALIKLTAIVDNISGKLNGTVFARNKGGHYMRSKSNPTNPQTSIQMGVRAGFGFISGLWRGLSDPQRRAWEGMAIDYPYQNRLGDTKYLSGFGLHQQLNTNLSLIGRPAIATPSAPRSMDAPHDITIDALDDSRVNLIGEFGVADNIGSRILVYATPPMSAGIANFKTQLRLIGAYPNPVGLGVLDLKAEYLEKFGAPVTGARVGFKIVGVSGISGQATAPFYLDGIAQ